MLILEPFKFGLALSELRRWNSCHRIRQVTSISAIAARKRVWIAVILITPTELVATSFAASVDVTAAANGRNQKRVGLSRTGTDLASRDVIVLNRHKKHQCRFPKL